MGPSASPLPDTAGTAAATGAAPAFPDLGLDLAAGAAAGTAGAAAVEYESEPTGDPDIDSLMKELDRISNEILKRGPPRKPVTGAPEPAETPTPP
jgi:hypothetical protein